jgi:hypothetical protein
MGKTRPLNDQVEQRDMRTMGRKKRGRGADWEAG